MSKRTNYPEYADPITNYGHQDSAAITSSQSKIPGAGNGNGSGTPFEERGVCGSNPCSRTNIYPATHSHPDITRQMCRILGVRPHHRVLEPSAGSGGMVEVIQEFTNNVTAVELNGGFYMQLCTQHRDVERYRKDFLRLTPNQLGLFDHIIMCPPPDSTIHIQHANKFLKPGGSLMALVQEQNIDIKGWGRSYNRTELCFKLGDQRVQCGIIFIKMDLYKGEQV